MYSSAYYIVAHHLKLAQVSIALISLTYSLVDGRDYTATYLIAGNVSTANLACYWGGDGGHACRHEPEYYQAAAHGYGELAKSSDCGPYDELSDILNSKHNCPYYCRRTAGREEFSYRFLDYNPDDAQGSYPLLTNRTITASSGPCFECENVSLIPVLDATGGQASSWKYTYSNSSFSSSIVLPKLAGDFNGTTYVYRDINVPSQASTYSCGPRCIIMWAHKNPG